MSTTSGPSAAQLRDRSEKWLRELGYEVERQSPSWWTATKRSEDGRIERYKVYARVVPKQEEGHDGADFKLDGYRLETLDRPDLCPTGELSADGRIEAWLVAWYRVDSVTGEPEIQLTLGLRRNLDMRRKYKTVIDNRPLDRMLKGDYLNRMTVPLGRGLQTE